MEIAEQAALFFQDFKCMITSIFKITLAIRFLLIYKGGRGRGCMLKLTWNTNKYCYKI